MAAFSLNLTASDVYAHTWSSRDRWLVALIAALLVVNLVGTEVLRRLSDDLDDMRRREAFLAIAAEHAKYLQDAGRQGRTQVVEDGLKVLDKLYRRAKRKK